MLLKMIHFIRSQSIFPVLICGGRTFASKAYHMIPRTLPKLPKCNFDRRENIVMHNCTTHTHTSICILQFAYFQPEKVAYYKAMR